jgi:hypothetical protein
LHTIQGERLRETLAGLFQNNPKEKVEILVNSVYGLPLLKILDWLK